MTLYSLRIRFILPQLPKPLEEIEQRERDQDKEQDRQPQVHVQRLRQYCAAQVSNGRNGWKHARIDRTVNQGSGQETKQTGDQIVEITLAATGDAGAWSETGAGHADAKDQPADQVAGDKG